jgi:hypothetical protein
MVVDVKERQFVNAMPGGVQSFMSWTRLIEALRKTGEFHDDEIVTHIGADLTGVTFRYK